MRLKNIHLGALKAMTLASIKMYFRDFTAIFFTLLFPVIFLLVFGFIATRDSIQLDIAYINQSSSEIAMQFDSALQNVVVDDQADEETNKGKIFKVNDELNDPNVARQAVADGDVNVAIIVPEVFGQVDQQGQISGQVNVIFDESESEFGQTAVAIIESILEDFNRQANQQAFGIEPISPFKVDSQNVASDELDGVDYVVPGIIAFSLMSLGIFSISQGFITYKSSGALRRLFVTPISPFNFIVAQMITRLLMVLINVWTMLAIAVVLFGFSLVGDVINFSLVSLIGAIMFLGVGFALAGWAKNENQAAPLSNIIFFPMMFLSGTFFPRELFPGWLQPIADFLPLSFLADGLRLVANEGATILSLGSEMAGMLVWTVLIYLIAVKVFRWE